MEYQDKKTLVKQAARLTTLGMELDRRRARVAKLVDKGYAKSSPKVLEAFREWKAADDEWNRLAEEHMELRTKLLESELRL